MPRSLPENLHCRGFTGFSSNFSTSPRVRAKVLMADSIGAGVVRSIPGAFEPLARG